MATTWKTITVRVERPPETSLAVFFAEMRSWLDHRCIIPAEFNGITSETKSGVFDVLFDDPRDALLFARRFAAQATGSNPVSIAPRGAIGANTSLIDRGRVSISAAFAGVMRGILRRRTKLYQGA
jgi:hypothetical protein